MTDINSETISSFLNCFLCGEPYRRPRLLWCLHSYCESCLTEYIKDFQKATRELEDKTEYNLTCPQCTTEVESSTTDGTNLTIGYFPRNFFTERLIQKEWGDGEPPGDRAEIWKSQVFNAQPFTTKKEPTNSRILTCCQRERDQTLDKTDHYCVDCDQILCNICQMTDHMEHRCATLQAVSTNFGQKVTNPIHRITSQIKHLQMKYETVKENQELYHSNHQRIQSQIKEQTVSLIEMVKDYEKLLLEKVEERHKSVKELLDNQEPAMAAHISALTSALDFTSMLRQYGTDEEKVSLRKMVGKRLQELCDEHVEYKINRVKFYTLRKSEVSLEHIGKIYGDLQEETTLSDLKQKAATKDTVTLENPKVSLEHERNIYKGLQEESTQNNSNQKGATSEQATREHAAREHAAREHAAREHATSKHPTRDIVALQNPGKIYRNLQEDTILKDNNRKTNTRGLLTEDRVNIQSIGSDSSKQNALITTNKRKTAKEDITKQLPVCEPIWEVQLPCEISQYGIRGIGINSIGNLVIGGSLVHSQAVYIVDGHCAKIMDRYIIDDGWTLHTITSTGKGVMYLARGRCKFKVKILECSDGIKILQETQIECVGINTITVDAQNQLLIAANRYIEDSEFSGKAIKSDTNITIFDSRTGAIRQRLTNQMYKNQSIDLLQQPECLLSCENGEILLADSGCHSIARLTSEGKVLFKCNVSECPNNLCADKDGHILVGFKHEKKISVLSKAGEVRSFLLTEVPKFFVIGKDKNLLVLDSSGTIRHFEYHKILKAYHPEAPQLYEESSKFWILV